MNIVQKPEPLSLSMNLRPFVLNSTAQVSFRLKQGSTTLLSQRYDPDADGRIEIDVRDVIHARLSFDLRPEATEPYSQDAQCGVFTAVIDSTYISFTVVRGGVKPLSGTCADFLATHFLTWQPQTKYITSRQPELLTYYAPTDCYVYISGVDREGNELSEELVEAIDAGEMVTLPVDYETACELLGEDVSEYTVWVEKSSGSRLTYRQRYVLQSPRSRYETYFLFENSLGGVDCLKAYGHTSLQAAHTHNIALTEDRQQEYRVDTERRWQKHTGYISRAEALWLLDFAPSLAKYIWENGSVRQIIVSDSSFEGDVDAGPVDFTFSYGYAEAPLHPLLGLSREGLPASPGLDLSYPTTPGDAYLEDPDEDIPPTTTPGGGSESGGDEEDGGDTGGDDGGSGLPPGEDESSNPLG